MKTIKGEIISTKECVLKGDTYVSLWIKNDTESLVPRKAFMLIPMELEYPKGGGIQLSQMSSYILHTEKGDNVTLQVDDFESKRVGGFENLTKKLSCLKPDK